VQSDDGAAVIGVEQELLPLATRSHDVQTDQGVLHTTWREAALEVPGIRCVDRGDGTAERALLDEPPR
jgi:hypothetical protein